MKCTFREPLDPALGRSRAPESCRTLPACALEEYRERRLPAETLRTLARAYPECNLKSNAPHAHARRADFGRLDDHSARPELGHLLQPHSKNR